MKLNLTLFIQAFHFYCAYRIVRDGIVAPLYGHIERQDKEDELRRISIAQHTDEIQQLLQKRDAVWKQFHSEMISLMPRIESKQIQVSAAEKSSYIPHSSEDSQQIANMIVASIEEQF